MKIVHLDLGGFHTENMRYQMNLLSACNIQVGKRVPARKPPLMSSARNGSAYAKKFADSNP